MRTTITLAGREHPCFEVRGAADGPRVAVIGGVRGCEYSSIAAVTRVMRTLETAEIAGTVVGVPVVSLQSFEQRSPFVVPADGENLNGTFPGDPAGAYTDRLAHDIFTALIEPADALLDLHGGDLVEALEPFALYCDTASHELALAAGACDALRHLGVLDGAPAPPRWRTMRRFDWIRGEHAGFWVAAVGPGDEVAAGRPLGEIRDLYGETLETIVAPAPGVVLFLTTSAAVPADGLLMGVGG